MNIFLSIVVVIELAAFVSSLEAPLLSPDQITIHDIPMCLKLSSGTNISTQPQKDCLSITLQFLGDKSDLDNFKLTSYAFKEVYDEYMDFQQAKFCNLFQNDSSPNAYQSLEKLVRSDPVPMIPSIYHDIKDDDMNKLFLIHQRMRKDIIRGLTAGTNHPFLSVLLKNSMKRGLYSVMVWVFEPNFVPEFMVLTRKICDDGTMFFGTYGLHELPLSMELLNKLMRTKSMEVFVGHNNQSEFWTIGRRCCSKASCSEYLHQYGIDKACTRCQCAGRHKRSIFYKWVIILTFASASVILTLLLILGIVASL